MSKLSEDNDQKKKSLCASSVPNTESLKTYTLVHTQCERVLHAELLFLDGMRGRGIKQVSFLFWMAPRGSHSFASEKNQSVVSNRPQNFPVIDL